MRPKNSIFPSGNHLAKSSGYLPSLELPNLYNLSNLQTGATASLSGNLSEQEISSAYAYGQFSFKEMVFLDFTARNDWASILPVANNSFFYPSVAGSLLISKMVDLSAAKIDFLKVRGGWSEVGSTGALGAYAINSTFGLANTWIYFINAISPRSIWNCNCTIF